MKSSYRNSIMVLAIVFANFGACASGGKDYTYYVIHPEQKPPALWAADPKDDLDLAKACSPDPECSQPKPPKTAKCGKCVGLFSDEFFKAKKEILYLRQALKDCQHGPQPGVKTQELETE